jgi:hypothetical protein
MMAMGSQGETNQGDASLRIVNGITFRERETISLRDVWLYGILSLPDIFVSLFVLAVVGCCAALTSTGRDRCRSDRKRKKSTAFSV